VELSGPFDRENLFVRWLAWRARLAKLGLVQPSFDANEVLMVDLIAFYVRMKKSDNIF
jgi:hypothetical protein